jgi:hypothetical protein
MSSSSNSAKRRRADKKAINLKIDEEKDKIFALNKRLKRGKKIEFNDLPTE